MNTQQERSFISGRQVRPFDIAADAVDNGFVRELGKLGIFIGQNTIDRMYQLNKAGVGMDDLISTVFPGTIGTPLQFLQTWLPGFVRAITAVRSIDRLVGISTLGSWDDEEVVQGVLEPTGKAAIYSDYTNIPLSSWNPSFERRTVVRFEQGLKVGPLEEARAARMNVNTAAEKRGAAATSLEIARNRIGFYGFNGGVARTYGFLNDPSLPAYYTVAAGVGGTTWATKTYLEIIADVRGILARLQTQSQGNIDPRYTAVTLALPNSVAQYLTVTSEFGNSVESWINETYKQLRIETAPELDGANGGANVMYAYADSVSDGSSDDGRVWTQIVPAKFQMLGVDKQAKGYVEDYVSATAGVMLKRPYAVSRASGI